MTAGAAFSAGQTLPTPTPTPGAATAETTPVAAATPVPAEPSAPAPPPEPEKTGIFPDVNIYLPEGRADIRLLKPIRNSLFENQINYNFVSGDISAFLRYKYYGRRATSTFTFFDSIEFEELEQLSNDFSRTRGALYLQRRPINYYNRFYGLLEFDRLTFSRPVDHHHAHVAVIEERERCRLRPRQQHDRQAERAEAASVRSTFLGTAAREDRRDRIRRRRPGVRQGGRGTRRRQAGGAARYA